MRQRIDRCACTREPGSDHQCLLSGLGLNRNGKDGWLPTSKVTRLVSLLDFLNSLRLTRVGISRRCQDSNPIRIGGHRWRHGKVLGKSFHCRLWGWSSDGMVACVPIPKITICTVLPVVSLPSVYFPNFHVYKTMLLTRPIAQPQSDR